MPGGPDHIYGGSRVPGRSYGLRFVLPRWPGLFRQYLVQGPAVVRHRRVCRTQRPSVLPKRSPDPRHPRSRQYMSPNSPPPMTTRRHHVSVRPAVPAGPSRLRRGDLDRHDVAGHRDLRLAVLRCACLRSGPDTTAISPIAPMRPAGCFNSSSPFSRKAPRRRAFCGGPPSIGTTICIPIPNTTCIRRGTRASSTAMSAGFSTGSTMRPIW